MRGVSALLLAALLSSFAGCEKVSSILKRQSLPDMGPPLPTTVRMELDPSLTTAVAGYADACNHPWELKIGEELESVLLDAAHQTFQTVYVAGAGPAEPEPGPDFIIKISLEQSGLRIQTDNVYDRLPTELTLEALVLYKDRTGKILAERPIKTTHRDKVILEPTQHRCEYWTMDRFLHDTVIALSTQFARASRDLFEQGSQAAAAGQGVTPATTATAKPAAGQGPTLSFKATIVDENGNLILENGERVTIRVEVVNTGSAPANGVSATVTGSPIILSQFPASSLPVGTLQPGESRTLEFSGTVPPAVQPQRVDLVVAVTEPSASGSPPAQSLAAMVRPSAEIKERTSPSGVSFNNINIDRVPEAVPGFERPQTYVISVGISTHRDQQSLVRKYAAMDAELVAAYFRALGGVPASNVRVLQDWKALRPDIEETILDWLPTHVTLDSSVIVYFAGQAKVSPSGEIFLVPYEGGQSTSRLYPVKDMLASLARLKARQILLIFDGSVSKLGEARGKSKDPQWGPNGASIVRLIGTTGFQASLESEKLHHSLFTYYLLRGLRGEADDNRDKIITLGELTVFLGRAVPDAARQAFNQDQRPLVIPSIQPGSKLATVTLTKLAPAAVANGR